MASAGEKPLDADSSDEKKDCAWCKIMEQKICKKPYDAFDACMEREGDEGDQKCMELFEELRKCMNQKPSLLAMLKGMVTGPPDG
ncbi:hypothetical protein PLESTF_000266300 [Pleodorina starrii]|nr:hypothetical protein PLESTM_001227200 [Pleodorina starrii]GLC65232.1 hypothetical protein PLESTF_000266300 [Pleodorina starrii]